MTDTQDNEFTYQNTDMLCNVVPTENGYSYILCDWEGAIVRSGKLKGQILSKEEVFKAIFLKHCDFVFPSMAYANDFPQINYLIEKGVDVHYKNDLALREAVANKYSRETDKIETVKILLEHGANPYSIDENTFQDLKMSPYKKVFELIQEYREKAKIPIPLKTPSKRSIREMLKSMKAKCDRINAGHQASERSNRNIDMTR